MKRRQEPSCKFFSFNRHDAEGRIFRDTAPKEGNNARPLSPVKAGVVPALTLKSNVAAILDAPVKCIA